MSSTVAPSLDYPRLFRQGAPDPAPRFGGFPKYNFVGGHKDPAHIPVEALSDSRLHPRPLPHVTAWRASIAA